ncbi:MAG: nicotinate-nicotinamide nucleotide adenylyltransferase [Blastocatellia bacterium]
MRKDLTADLDSSLARLREIVAREARQSEPHIELIKRAEPGGARVGVFASSFNPVTVAHFELMRRALTEFSLDEVLALAGRANADKQQYECALEDRLNMLALALGDDARISIGLSSHAFYVDMLDALAPLYGQSDLHFIVGFDTFERVLDTDDRYTARYHHRFGSRDAALRQLFSHSRFIVAGRAGAGLDDVRALLAAEPAEFGERVSYLDFPSDLGERSATEVRAARRAGQAISELVPPAVESYIEARGLYV